MGFVARTVRWTGALALGAGSLTALVGVSAVAAAPASPTTLYVATTGSDNSNSCQTQGSPCATIQHAVTEAATTSGAVTIEVGQGTYAQRVTVPAVGFSGTYDPTSLVVEPNPANATPVVVEPVSTAFTGTANLPSVPNALQAYDDFGGRNIYAIIGVGQPGEGDTYEGFQTNVTVSGLTVNGSDNPETPASTVAGIAYVNASGTITGNTVTDLDTEPVRWSSNQEHGIDVRSVNPSAAATPGRTVAVTDNVLGSATASATSPDWAGHVLIDLMSTGDGTVTAGSLAATVSGNSIYGMKIDAAEIDKGAQFASQNGIAAAGLTGLAVSGNTVKDLQSAGYGGAVDLGPVASGAACVVDGGNQLVTDDYGVDINGSEGCTVSDDTITTGFFGVGVDAVPSWGPAGQQNLPSTDDTVTDNDITGTTTVLTTESVAKAPIDGVLVTDGPTTTVTGNTISGFVSDVYVGIDPLRYNGSATWSDGTPAEATTLATTAWSTAGTVVHGNSLGTLATPASGQGVVGDGVACRYTPVKAGTPQGCSAAAPLDAAGNWWGDPSGPGSVGPGSGTTVSTDVTFSPWWTTTDGLPTAPVSVTATAGVASAVVHWSAPVPSGTSTESLTSYAVTVSPGGRTVTAAGSATTVTVTGLTPGDRYTFSVTATNGVGTGPAGASNAVVPVTVAPTASANSGTTVPASGTATVPPVTTPAGGPGVAPVTISASATGTPGSTGTVTVSAYPSDPVAGLLAGSSYFDVSVSPGSSFTQVRFQVCGIPPGQVVQWWNPIAQSFQPVSNQTAATGSPLCVTVTITSTTTPAIDDLYGTVFATAAPSSGPQTGYWEVASDGGVFAFGTSQFYGSMGGKALDAPIVGIAPTPDAAGYWEVAGDGGVFAFGDATFYGSMGGKALDAPIVGIAATPDGKGYWLVASDGGVFTFGDATFSGSMGGKPLDAPIVGIAATPDGKGYWLVASDGGIFTFGDADFSGSMGGKPLDKPIVGMTVAPTGQGYWEVASDGGVFSFGAATFEGSMGGQPLNAPVVGIAPVPVNGQGYWEVASDGGVFSFGAATFEGSMGGQPLNAPIVGVAS